MNNKNFSNPIYQKLFPETYAKNAKLQAALASMKDKLNINSVIKTNIKTADMNPELNDAG